MQTNTSQSQALLCLGLLHICVCTSGIKMNLHMCNIPWNHSMSTQEWIVSTLINLQKNLCFLENIYAIFSYHMLFSKWGRLLWYESTSYMTLLFTSTTCVIYPKYILCRLRYWLWESNAVDNEQKLTWEYINFKESSCYMEATKEGRKKI